MASLTVPAALFDTVTFPAFKALKALGPQNPVKSTSAPALTILLAAWIPAPFMAFTFELLSTTSKSLVSGSTMIKYAAQPKRGSTCASRFVPWDVIAIFILYCTSPATADLIIANYGKISSYKVFHNRSDLRSCGVMIYIDSCLTKTHKRSHSNTAKTIASFLAINMAGLTALMRAGLNIVDFIHTFLGSSSFGNLIRLLRAVSANKIPLWTPAMPKGAKPVKRALIDSSNPLKVVYFPTCINRAMGVSKDYDEKVGLIQKTESLLKKAGFEVIYPDNLNALCCGMAFTSKGFTVAGKRKSTELESALVIASDNGSIPIYVDMSPCLYRMKESFESNIRLYEPIEFILEFVADKLDFEPLQQTVVIHATCSSKKMELAEKLAKLAEMCAQKVIAPEGNCCGFAGDRGFTYPELNKSGLEELKGQIPADCQAGYSTSRTCEIGLTMHSGISYKSIVYLVDRCTRPRLNQ